MPTLLKVDVSPRGDQSVSRAVGAKFVEQWTKAHDGGSVNTRDLAKTAMPFVDVPWMTAAYTPEDLRTPEHREALKLSDEMLGEIQNADHILLTTGMYNFAVPAALKAWIDHIVRSGKSFSANPDGSYTGLIKGKKATIVIASSGSYQPGTPTETYNYERPYLKQILGFIGITDVEFVEAGGTYLIMTGKKSVNELIDSLQGEIERTAAR